MPARPRIVAVCGASQASDDDRSNATAVGRLLAERGFLVVCGGGRGVATAVAAAVHASGGTCIGLLPGDAPEDAALHSWSVSRPGESESDPAVHHASTPEEAVEWVEQSLV